MRAEKLELLEWITIGLVAATVMQWVGCGTDPSQRPCPPYPTITTVAPQPLRAVNADTVIQVTGRNFDVTSFATFNGELRTTMVESSQVLHVLLNAADMSRPQVGTLVVVTPDPRPVPTSYDTGMAPCGDRASAGFTVAISP